MAEQFTVVDSAGVEITPQEAPDAQAKLKAIVQRIRKAAQVSILAQLDARRLVHDASVAVSRASKQVQELDVDIALRAGALAHIHEQLAAIKRDSGNIKVGIDVDKDRLRRMTRDARATVNIDVDKVSAERQLRELAQKAHDIGVTVEVDVDKAAATRQLRDIKKEARKLGATVNVDVDKGVAMAKLRTLVRSRFVDVVPRVNAAALLAAKASLTTIGRTTGLDKVAESARSFSRAITPGTALKIGTWAGAILTLGSAGVTGAANLMSLVGSLAALGGAATALPGLFAAAGVGAVTLQWAMKDMAVQAPGLVDSWKRLKATVSENFWSTAAKPISELTSHWLPSLSTAWSRSARVMGQEAGFFSKAAGEAFDASFIQQFFSHLDAGVTAFRPTLQPLLSGMRDLVLFGSSKLPGLSAWASRVAGDFGKSISQMATSGRLDSMLAGGVAALRDLGAAADGLFGAIMGVARAAEQSGATTLATLADSMQRLDAVINSADFQSALTSMFTTARANLDAFLGAAGPGVQNLLLSLMDTVNKIGPEIGASLGLLVGSLADVLASGSVQNGLIALFDGLAQAVQLAAPHLARMAPALGQVLTALGGLAAGVLPELVDVFATIATAMAPVLANLADLAVQVMPTLAAALGDVATQLGTALADPAIMDAFAAAIVAVGDAVIALAPSIPGLVNGLAQIVEFVATTFGPWLPVIAENLNVILPLVVGAITAFKAFQLASLVGLTLTGPVGLAIAALAVLAGAIVALVMNWDDVKSAASGAMSFIGDLFNGAGTWLVSSGQALIMGFVDGIQSAFGALQDIAAKVIGVFPGGDTLNAKLGLTGQTRQTGELARNSGSSNGGSVINNVTIHNPVLRSAAQELANNATTVSAASLL